MVAEVSAWVKEVMMNSHSMLYAIFLALSIGTWMTALYLVDRKFEATFYGSNGVSDPVHSLVSKVHDPDPGLDVELTRCHHLQDRFRHCQWQL
jgi:hypothetical protein